MEEEIRQLAETINITSAECLALSKEIEDLQRKMMSKIADYNRAVKRLQEIASRAI